MLPGKEKVVPLELEEKSKFHRLLRFQAFVDVGLRDLERSFDFAGEANHLIAYYVIHKLHTQRNRKTKKNETQGLQNSINFRSRGGEKSRIERNLMTFELLLMVFV